MPSSPILRARPRTVLFISICVALVAFVSLRASRQHASAAALRGVSRDPAPTLLAPDKSTIAPAANTITVNSTADVTNSTDGLCTLREAITAANTNTASGAAAGECIAGSSSGDDTINFSVTGTIDLTVALPNMSSNMIISGPGSGLLTVQRSAAVGTPGLRIFTIDSGKTVAISGLTASKGSGVPSGGGIQNNGTLTLTNCTVSDNQTSSGNPGGGIYVEFSGTLILSNSTVSGNQTGAGSPGGPSGYGGGIFNIGTASIINSTVSNNKTGPPGMVAGQGGGVFNGGGTLTVTNSTITGNQTASSFNSEGGGIFNTSSMTVTNSTISNNKSGTSGGGIYHQSGTMTLANSTISGNQAVSGGGVATSNITSIFNCLISNNTATTGGGVAANGNPFKMANTTISDNKSTGTAGGLQYTGLVVLTNVTITNNRSDSDNSGGEQGGGISRNFGTITLKNALVAGNFRGTGATADDINGPVDLASSFNLIGAGGSGGLTNGVNNNQVGIADPRLGLLANNGGPTFTYSLLSDSPALDAGDNCVTQTSHCGDANIPQIMADQRGFKRLADGPDADAIATVDIGAYETQGPLADLPDTSTNEDTQLIVAFDAGDTSTITSVTASSSNPILVSNDSIHLSAVLAGTTGAVTINPVADLSGTTNITVTVNRTGGASASKTFMLTVNSVNDVPTFTKGADQTINEDAGAQTVSNWATNVSAGPADEAGQTLTSQVTNNTNAALFSSAPAFSSTGTLTYTPAADANGSATITIVLKDNGGTLNGGVDTSAPQTFTITVNSVNDAPSFTAGPDQTVNEDSGFKIVSNWATVISSGPENESGQSVNFLVTNNSNPSLFSSGPTLNFQGTLSFTPAPNANGSATITVVLKDNGGTANGGVDTSPPQTFTITVNAVNDAPSFTKGVDQMVNNNAGAQTILNWASGISAGPANESAQTLSFQVTGNSNPSLFAVAPAISPTGILTYQPAANAGGAATITITLKDNGGTSNGGQDTSAAQSFNVNINPVGGSLKFNSDSGSTTESSGSTTVTVIRAGDMSQAVTVDYATSGDTGLPCSTPGTASPKCDFTSALGTLKFAAGENTKTVTILISQDSFVEGPETFTVSLSNQTGGSALASPVTATIMINDDVTEPSTNSIDDASNFVRQQYHDFLNREPDASGLAFWTNEITSCGSDQACIDLKRINVSAAFYLSIEFQETGYLVERIHKTAYGDDSGMSTLGGAHQVAVPIIRLNEFLPETQKIGQGVIVGQGNWQQQLENNKQGYMAEFVQRPRFTTAYPASMTAARFVDKLNLNAGNPLSPVERDQLASELSTNVTTRAQVLRAIAENQILKSAEFNRAFVLIQYFGYLRRNPNDPQDTDYTGYDFWLSKLNQFNGNFVNADMVKSFIVAGEYRTRFGL